MRGGGGIFGYLPGTKIEADLSRNDLPDSILTPLFMAGGLVLSQISQLTGLEAHTIQNWVKRGYVTSPVRKKYTRNQFSRIAIINMLKDTMQIDHIAGMLAYVNGPLDSETDGMVNDSRLYVYFTTLIVRLGQSPEPDLSVLAEEISSLLRNYQGLLPDSREKLHKVLRIMAIAYASGRLKQSCEEMYAQIDELSYVKN